MTPRRRTLGDAQSAQYTQIAGSLATAGVSAAVPLHILTAATAGPIGAAVAGVALLAAYLIANSGCGPTCVIATGLVDALEPKLRANRDAYLSSPTRTAADQAAALAAFDFAFTALRSSNACGAPELGDAGRRCISDRDRGGKWDWYAYYRDPIERTPPNNIATIEALTASPWFVPAAAVAALIGVVALL